MFKLLRDESDEVALRDGIVVPILPAAQQRIVDNEDLGDHLGDQYADDERVNYLARDFLNAWCRRNIKGKWDKVNAEGNPVLKYRFARKSEAVRFKMTWGGQ